MQFWGFKHPSPTLWVAYSSIEHIFLLEGRKSPVLWLRYTISEELVGQDSLVRSLRTMQGLGLGPKAWQAQCSVPEAKYRESEVKAVVSMLLRLEFVLIKSARCRFNLMGARSLSLTGFFVQFQIA